MTEHDKLEEALAGFCADLVSFKKNEAFLYRLFEYDAGTMLYVRELCTELPDVATRLTDLEYQIGDNLRVGWLEFSESPYGKGFVLILFFVEEVFWSTVALYNPGALKPN